MTNMIQIKFLLILLTVLNMDSPFLTQVTLRHLGLDTDCKLNKNYIVIVYVFKLFIVIASYYLKQVEFF